MKPRMGPPYKESHTQTTAREFEAEKPHCSQHPTTYVTHWRLYPALMSPTTYVVGSYPKYTKPCIATFPDHRREISPIGSRNLQQTTKPLKTGQLFPQQIHLKTRYKLQTQAFPLVLVLKKPPAKERDARDEGLIPGLGRTPLRRQWQPTPVSLPENFHGQRSLAGYSPWGHKESDTTEHPHRNDRI